MAVALCFSSHIYYIFLVPKELRESMPVEDIDALASLALANAEYPMKQESHPSLVSV